MYAKNIALSAARTEAFTMKSSWEHLAFRISKTAEERSRALSMADRWRLVAMALDYRISGKGFGTHDEGTLEVANALVQAKSEIAYGVDHG